MRESHHAQEGGVTAFVAIAMIPLMIALALAVEFACVYAQHCAFENDLNIAREETFSAGFELQLKNSSSPGELISSRLAASLRSNNYSGSIQVWFYEASAAEIAAACNNAKAPNCVRAMAYHVVAQRDYNTVMMPASWLSGLTVSNGTTAVFCPYAAHKTYQAAETGVLTCYSFDADSQNMAITYPQRSQAAPAMQQAVDHALSKAVQEFEENQ